MDRMSFEDELRVERLSEHTDVSSFSCGAEAIDNILWNYAHVLQRDSKAVTNLFFLGEKLVGFCTLLADRVSISPTSLTFPDGDYISYFPAIQLYAFGVQREFQSNGLGTTILEWIIGTVYELRKEIAVRFIALEALYDLELIKFYERNGFVKWRYLDEHSDELLPMIYDFDGLE